MKIKINVVLESDTKRFAFAAADKAKSDLVSTKVVLEFLNQFIDCSWPASEEHPKRMPMHFQLRHTKYAEYRNVQELERAINSNGGAIAFMNAMELGSGYFQQRQIINSFINQLPSPAMSIFSDKIPVHSFGWEALEIIEKHNIPFLFCITGIEDGIVCRTVYKNTGKTRESFNQILRNGKWVNEE